MHRGGRSAGHFKPRLVNGDGRGRRPPARRLYSTAVMVLLALAAGAGSALFVDGRFETAASPRPLVALQIASGGSGNPVMPVAVRPGMGLDPASVSVAAMRRMPVCAERRRNCVVDGDTLWLDGEKIRLEAIDAPEIRGQCRSEAELASAATRRLSELLSGSDLTVERKGRDRYGRTLARIHVRQGEAGAVLVREGLARAWMGRREGWCAA